MLARFRPARSRAATAMALSPAFGSGTLAVFAKAGIAGRLRASGAIPRLAQPPSIRLAEKALISNRTPRKFGFEFFLNFTVYPFLFGLFC